MQQPNFGQISDHLHQVGDELRLLQNLPVVQDGQAIAEAFHHLSDRLDQMQDRMEQMQVQLTNAIDQLGQRLEDRIDDLAREMRTRDQNTRSCLYNRTVVQLPDVRLEPLYSLDTGDIIPDFPATLHDIEVLSHEVIDRIFVHLHQPIPGGHITHRQKLVRYACGVWRA